MSVFIIAEAGVNHDGKVAQALRLIEAAREAGADAVKFQLFSARKLGRPELEPLELTYDEMETLYRASEGIEFLCTPFDVEALHFLVRLGMQRVKIASGSITNLELLYAAYATGLPVILSTGMSTLSEIDRALGALHAHVTLLHCTSAYPCPLAEVNLNAMDTLRTRFRLPVGYSDHTEGITVALAAVAKAATVIEKHLTLDRTASGPDHKASIEPDKFRAMTQLIRQVSQALGDGVKRVMPSEMPARKLWFPTA